MEPQEAGEDGLVTAFTLKDPNKAEIIKNALRDAGIPCELDGEGQAGLATILDIGVLVRTQDAARARRLIAHHEPEQGTPPASIASHG